VVTEVVLALVVEALALAVALVDAEVVHRRVGQAVSVHPVDKVVMLYHRAVLSLDHHKSAIMTIEVHHLRADLQVGMITMIEIQSGQGINLIVFGHSPLSVQSS